MIRLTRDQDGGRDEADEQMRAEEYLEVGESRGLDDGEREPAAPLPVQESREGDERAAREEQPRDDGVYVEQRHEQVALQEIGPVEGRRVSGEDEREVREQEGPRSQR